MKLLTPERRGSKENPFQGGTLCESIDKITSLEEHAPGSVTMHHKKRRGQGWCLICRQRANVWLSSMDRHEEHPARCHLVEPCISA
jgi:hypothetical protein